ncbi:hypothetical protein EVAR_76687_1 [Eumeta japonica]|uniref:Uncharacterized protein n=1 Tax=Eumeta variegata TaxID=151549 RepID=A0A4C1SV51_EUMVA|nr:hypothetical protein EVAR_76687_1 [Eumeta japonica]
MKYDNLLNWTPINRARLLDVPAEPRSRRTGDELNASFAIPRRYLDMGFRLKIQLRVRITKLFQKVQIVVGMYNAAARVERFLGPIHTHALRLVSPLTTTDGCQFSRRT